MREEAEGHAIGVKAAGFCARRADFGDEFSHGAAVNVSRRHLLDTGANGVKAWACNSALPAGTIASTGQTARQSSKSQQFS